MDKSSEMLVEVRSNKTVKYSNIHAVWSYLLGYQSTLAKEPCSSRPKRHCDKFGGQCGARKVFLTKMTANTTKAINYSKLHKNRTIRKSSQCVCDSVCLQCPGVNLQVQPRSERTWPEAMPSCPGAQKIPWKHMVQVTWSKSHGLHEQYDI